MKKKWIALAVIIGLLLAPAVWAICTQTTVYFNIATLVAYTVTLPGPTGGTYGANSSCAPTAAVEFNVTNATTANVDARVVGGTQQSNGVPIFVFDNTGTVDINVSTSLNSALPSCINLTGASTYAGADNGAEISTTNVSIVNDFGPNTGTQDWYMKADFSACLASDSTSRTLRTYGIQS